MNRSDKVNEIFKALTKFRENVKQPVKDKKNPFFKSDYVTLEGVQKSIDEALKDTGLSYSQIVSDSEKGTSVSTIITHESGQFIETGKLTLPPTKNDAQGNGSAITYARRYQLSGAFGISSDIDDDGDKASRPAKSNYGNTRAKKQYSDNAVDAKKKLFDGFVVLISKKLNSDVQTVKSQIVEQAEKKPEWPNGDSNVKATIMLNIAEAMKKQVSTSK